MADRSANSELERAAVIIALVIFGPVIALIALGRLLAAAAPILPIVGLALIGCVAAFAWHKYRTSPHTVRRQHETELAALLARATAQQAALPRRLDAAELAAALARHVPNAALAPAALFAVAQALYAADFLTALPGSPFANAGSRPSDIALDPHGNFAFVTDNASHNIKSFAVVAVSGQLLSVALPFTAGTSPL